LDPIKLPYQCEMSLRQDWVLLQATAVYDDQNNFLGTAIALQTITLERLRKERDRRLQEQVRDISQRLGDASKDLLGMSEQLAQGSSKTFLETQQVMLEAKDIQSSIQFIAFSVEQMAESLKSSETLVIRSNNISGEAVESSQQASKIIGNLGKNSLAIGKIIQLIHKIAQQTNILALNATIQATRAGEVGKGFGVVAREVKALASQTAEATKEISTQIKTIQKDTDSAIESIQHVSSLIEQMNAIAGEIYTAIVSQNYANDEISKRMEEASRGTKTINVHLDEVAQTAGDAQASSQKGTMAVSVVDRMVMNLNRIVTEIH
ncbi:MAG: hypothetical protein HQM12_22270, partial [SAR324 cluster bacterium]|nr:hypothetical protein [SAR324 cluster bacterium]